MGIRRLWRHPVIALGIVLCACGPGASEDCGLPGDEDGNGFADCQDATCSSAPNCQQGEEICDNNLDDNGNGAIDCQEVSCAGSPNCLPESDCEDGDDNDLDGQIDCADEDCAITVSCAELNCQDGLDDDNDLLADCDDPDCVNAANCNPEVDCQDLQDNDLDGDTDCEDSDCIQICAPLFCGNGDLDPGEECDDGNPFPGDGCGSNCQDEGCGDGLIQFPEECDDGNNDPGDGCDAICNVEPLCGDGILIFPPEECDDGNTVSGDGCSSTCLDEVICGDNDLEPPEVCEATNLSNQSCISQGFASGTLACGADCLSFDTSACIPSVCGNDVIETGEQCEDGNTADGDGCSAACQFEIFLEAEVNDNFGQANALLAVRDLVSQGAISPAGDLDFFALTLSSTSDVKLETFDGNGPSTCSGVNTVIELFGPDGVTSLVSDDNDGVGLCSLINSVGDAGARGLAPGTYFIKVRSSSAVTQISAYRLRVTLAASCGDGVIEGSEGCDDGNTADGDGCNAVCQSCGDAIVGTGEECDPPDGATCDDQCQRLPVCGDGFLDQGEQCDDGNLTDGDCCSAVCQAEAGCEVEPNDSSPAANGPFSPDFSVQASIDPAGEFDFFSFTIPALADVRLETSSAAALGSCLSINTFIELFGPDGTTSLVSDNDDGVNLCSLINSVGDAGARGLAPGTYFVKVRAASGGAVLNRYFLHVSLNSLCGDGVTEGSEQCDGGLGCDAQCQTFATCGDGLLNQVDEECDDGNITDGDGCDQGCLFERTFEIEPNDSIAEAQAAGLDFTVDQIILGDIEVAGDRDLFSVTLAAPNTLHIESFDGVLGSCNGIDTQIEVFAADGTKLASADEGGIGSCSSLDIDLPAGSFFVRIHDFDDDDIIPAYSLLIDFF